MTLAEYLDQLKEAHSTLDNPLYTLEDYLAMGEAVWNEANAKTKPLSQILEEENLRLADENEAGWTYIYIDQENVGDRQ